MFRRPMAAHAGTIRWIDVPQICLHCKAGAAAARKYEHNLKNGKAGMTGIADSSSTVEAKE